MYAADVEGHAGRLNFVVSGMLWNRSLVMQDLETKTLWSHILGRAMRGDLKGAELAVVPSVMTDWRSWLAEHPDTDVVRYSRTARRFTNAFYRELGEYALGVEVGGVTRAYPYDRLKRDRVVNERVGDVELLVCFAADSVSANAFRATVAGREGRLEFEADGGERIRDKESGSVWNALTGLAVSGELEGSQLQRLPGIPSYLKAWQRFHPDSTVYGE